MMLLGAAVPDPVLPVSWCRWDGGAELAPPSGLTLLTAWQLDAVALLGVLVVGVLYGWGVVRVRRAHPNGPWSRWRALAFAAGLLVVVLATHSSIAVYDMTTFSVHMIQHLMLIMVAPALLATGRPLTLLMHAVRNPWHTRVKRVLRSRIVSVVTFPPMALAQYTAVVVGTHLTGLMDQIMQRPWLGQAEHLLYLVSGFIFMMLLFGDEPIRWRLSMPGRILLVTVSTAVDTIVGVVLLQSTRPILMSPHPNWVADELADTKAGGAIMWVFGDGLMAVIMVMVFVSWSRLPERAQRQAHGWLENARLATFASTAGAVGSARPADSGAPEPPRHSPERQLDLDQDEAALAAYNAWLGRLNQH